MGRALPIWVVARRGRVRIVLRVVALFALLSGCAHDKARVVRRLADPESISLPACPTAFPAIPDEAARRGIYGVVLVGYVVEPTGRVDQIELEDRRASPLLFEAVKEWLDQCRGAEQERSP